MRGILGANPMLQVSHALQEEATSAADEACLKGIREIRPAHSVSIRELSSLGSFGFLFRRYLGIRKGPLLWEPRFVWAGDCDFLQIRAWTSQMAMVVFMGRHFYVPV